MAGTVLEQRYRVVWRVREDITAIEAAVLLCEACTDTIAQARIAVAEIHRTIERLNETRRRTQAILEKTHPHSSS
jgi:hypothetical protein